ncbi:Hypothetical predicted protein [Paramuricea clavata]|uniref:Methyltransferase domain-containing protein n=1 Tax=Paramuricea clavata TaxID=317549 RepID=A0A6S7H0G1_PARCT|nr:Hypothetical predicted protein [Paramuricea clavata]
MSAVRGSKHNAVLYSQINDFQQHFGKKLAFTAEIKHGDKVLDMGCGTGEVTAFLAELVGRQTQVVGVDPDIERIKVAVQKQSGIYENITFVHGDSSSTFPHFNEQYYDVHFSNFVLQWLNAQEKEKFIETASKTLKPGGKIAILSYEEDPVIIREAGKIVLEDIDNAKEKVQPYLVKKSVIEILLKRARFAVLHSEYFHNPYTFATAEDFLAFVYGSDYFDDTKISQRRKNDWVKTFVDKDGTVTLLYPTLYQIIGKKLD